MEVSMKKIGLISVSIHNYGSLLQTYAMQQILDQYGIDNDIILFKSDPIKQIYRVFNIPFMRMKLKLYKRKLMTMIMYREIYDGSKRRDKAFMSFKNDYCRFTKKITDRKELEDYGKKYDAYVLGSDQVWNPANLEMDFYTMNFIPENKSKIAYAPSFGVSNIPQKQIVKTCSYLQRIQHISVREFAGANIVKRLTGRTVPVVCDPTALLTKEDWDKLKSNRKYLDGKYIFCYFLGNNPLHREFANRVKKETGYQIVALQHIDEFVKGDLSFGDVTPYDVAPQDFINLLSNAEVVLTDSFHGTMFSIYYHKRFFTFKRYAEGEKDSTNSRIASILGMLHLEDRGLQGNENVTEALLREIKWEIVQASLEEFRDKSKTFLTNALKAENVI